jgi:hypothetical protein
MLLSCHQNAGQSYDIKIANRCFENVAQFSYLETTVRNQSLIQDEIKRKLNSGNACYRRKQWPRSLRHELPLLARLCMRLFYVCVVLCIRCGLATG